MKIEKWLIIGIFLIVLLSQGQKNTFSVGEIKGYTLEANPKFEFKTDESSLNTFYIGESPFKGASISFICNQKVEGTYTLKDDPNCFQITPWGYDTNKNGYVDYNEFLYSSGLFEINKYMTVEATPSSAKMVIESIEIEKEDGTMDKLYSKEFKWSVNHIITFVDLSFMDFIISEDKFISTLNNPGSIEYMVFNDLANGLMGGVDIVKTKQLLFSQESLSFASIFPLGTSQNSIPIDTTQLGQIDYSLTPYFSIIIRDQVYKFTKGDTATVSYNILPNILNISVDTSVTCRLGDCPDGYSCQTYLYDYKLDRLCIRDEIITSYVSWKHQPKYVKDDSFLTAQTIFVFIMIAFFAVWIFKHFKKRK